MVMMWCLNIKKEQPKKEGKKKMFSFVLFGIKLSNEHMWNLPLNIITVSS